MPFSSEKIGYDYPSYLYNSNHYGYDPICTTSPGSSPSAKGQRAGGSKAGPRQELRQERTLFLSK